MFEIKKAEKAKQKLRLLISGGSGSGKTYGSLELMSTLVKKFVVIDSENESSALYADKFNFDIISIKDNYSPEIYVEAIKTAEKAGYEGIIIDHATHEWSGPGGCLAMVDRASKRSSTGNSFTAWNGVTEKHNKFIEAILNSSCHMIVTCRAKTKYEMKLNSKGKNVPVKLGLEPIQRDGFEYEFTTVFNLDDEHCFTCSKDRTSLFTNIDEPVPLTKETAEKLLEWLGTGVEPKVTEPESQENAQKQDKDVSGLLDSTIRQLKKCDNEATFKVLREQCTELKPSLNQEELATLGKIVIETEKKIKGQING